MNNGLPSALIIGIDHFSALNLAQELVNKDIRVIGVGDFVMGINEMKNFEWLGNLDEVSGSFNYVFDFVGDKKDWEAIEAEKFALISINDSQRASFLKSEVVGWKADWRIIESSGVYGPGMDDGDFLSKVIKLAVQNKNLELPSQKKTIRLLSVVDLIEAVLRATFLSSTEKEFFLVLGEKINFENLAKILMDRAKMTRFKVLENDENIEEVDEKEIEISQKKLRWTAKTSFDSGIEETLQYFFSKMDEENRRKKKTGVVEVGKNLIKEQERVENKNRIYEVAVETDNYEEINPFINKKEELIEDQEKVLEEEELVVKEEVEKINEIEPKLIDYTDKKTEKKETDFESIKKESTEKENDYIEEESDDFNEIPKEDPYKKEIIKEKNVLTDKSQKTKKISLMKGKWWIVFVALVVFLSIEPIKWVVSIKTSIDNIKEVPVLIKNKKYLQAERLTDNSLNRLLKIDEKINDWGLNKFKTIRNLQTGIKVGEDVLVLEKKAVDLVSVADLMSEAVFFEKTINWSDEIEKLSEGISEAEGEIGVLQARLNGDYSWIPSKWKMEVQKQMKMVEEIRGQLETIKKFTKALPEFLGLDGLTKKYMVLFQNEFELRPTGGFISSYGILKFEKGRLLGLEIKDIYEADKLLNGEVEPPWEIKNILNEKKWFMRDANWKADFTKASGDIQWFLEKETGQKVDGVIGVNLAVAKSFLKVIGDTYVSDFKETITEANLYEQAEFYAETKFFPGSVQKVSFLGTVGKVLFEEIGGLSIEKKINLLQSIVNLLEENEIQLALNDTEVSEVVTNLGWDGKIYNGRCGVTDCVTDYLYIVEANLGVNKANYFLNRNIEQSVSIGQNQIDRILKINYENTAKNNNWPGGDYKNYLRIYLPKEVNLSQIKVVDASDVTNFKIYKNNEIRISEVGGKKEIGFLVTVPTLKKRVVEISYDSKIDLVGKTKFSYINYIQRQSGSGETGLVSLINYPNDWQPTQVQPAASLVGGKLLFNQILNKDIKMGIEIGK